MGVFAEGTIVCSELTWYHASRQKDKLPKLRGQLGQNLEDRAVIYEAIPTFLRNAGKAALGASTSPGLCLNNGKNFGFLSEPNCIWHLAAQSGVTHTILRFKEVGKKEKPSRGKRGSKQAGVQSLAQTKESQSGEVGWPMSKGQVSESPRRQPQ